MSDDKYHFSKVHKQNSLTGISKKWTIIWNIELHNFQITFAFILMSFKELACFILFNFTSCCSVNMIAVILQILCKLNQCKSNVGISILDFYSA